MSLWKAWKDAWDDHAELNSLTLYRDMAPENIAPPYATLSFQETQAADDSGMHYMEVVDAILTIRGTDPDAVEADFEESKHFFQRLPRRSSITGTKRVDSVRWNDAEMFEEEEGYEGQRIFTGAISYTCWVDKRVN